MSPFVRMLVYSLMAIFGLTAMYSILNAGNPDRFLRIVIPDPRYDVYVAGTTSFIVFMLGFVVFFARDREAFRQLLMLNQERIRKLRRKGKTDEEIAESLLAAMGSFSGYRHNLAKKKLIVYLSEFK